MGAPRRRLVWRRWSTALTSAPARVAYAAEYLTHQALAVVVNLKRVHGGKCASIESHDNRARSDPQSGRQNLSSVRRLFARHPGLDRECGVWNVRRCRARARGLCHLQHRLRLGMHRDPRTTATGPIRDRNVRSVSLPRRASAMSRSLTAGRRPRSFPDCRSPALFRVSIMTGRLSCRSAARSAFRARPRFSLSDARTGAVSAVPSLMRLRRTSCAQC